MRIHSFAVEQAIRYGLCEAIVLRGLALWLDTRQDDEDCFVKDGKVWLKLTMKQLQSELPYISPFKIKAALDVLRQEKLILMCDRELNSTLIRRKFMCYALTDKGYELTHEEG